jgi:hypothetical protein
MEPGELLSMIASGLRSICETCCIRTDGRTDGQTDGQLSDIMPTLYALRIAVGLKSTVSSILKI